MAGKRLLDAAKLFNAGRSIAKGHFGLRREQWEVYSQTSSLAKAVKSQTDKVTVTAGAAYELARRFNETGPAWQQRPREESEQQRPENVGSEWRQASQQTSAANDEALRHTTESGPVPTANVGTEHEDGTLSSLRKRELQRIAERQIPRQTADEEPVSRQDEGHDTFNKRGEHTSPELSSLPRSKIPKAHEEAQQSDERVDDRGIDSETFTARGSEGQAKGEEMPEGVTVDGVFHSPRISQMLGHSGEKPQNPYAGRQKLPPKPLPEMVAAERDRQSQSATPPQQTGSSVASSTEPVSDAYDVETEKLAQSIAADAEVGWHPATAFHLIAFVDAFPSPLHQTPHPLLHPLPPTKCENLVSRLLASVVSGNTAGSRPAWLLAPWARVSAVSLAAAAMAVSCSARAT